MKKYLGFVSLVGLAAACSSPAKTICPGAILVNEAGVGIGCAPVGDGDASEVAIDVVDATEAASEVAEAGEAGETSIDVADASDAGDAPETADVNETAGEAGDVSDASDASDVGACQPGQYVSEGQCVPCASGTFSTTNAANSCTTWQTCGAGTYVRAVGSSTSDRVCTHCSANSYSSTINATSCTVCGAGTYSTPNGGTSCVSYQSCNGLSTNCGTGATSETCCTTLPVPGGTFTQGTPTSTSGQTPFTETVSDFVLDKYEVTVGRFRQFVASYCGTPAAGEGSHSLIANSGWDVSWNANLPASSSALITNISCQATYQTWTTTAAGNEAKAINCVDWYEAFAFCIWDGGGYLPTASEWEYAATAGPQQREFPWGASVPTCTLANFQGVADGGLWYCSSPTGAVANAGVLPVGSDSAGSGYYGHQDLAGNVYEWNLDWTGAYPLIASTNYANLTPSASGRVYRGGAWNDPATSLPAAYTTANTPTARSAFLGFRCARNP